MKKLLLLFALIFCLNLFSFSQEAIYAVVQNDTVTIWHIEAFRNCASAYDMQFEIDGNKINLYQVDTVGAIAYCMCYFDLSGTITNLLPGYYEVDVFSVGDATSANDTTFWGSTSFTILSGDGMPQLLANTQSDCYDPTSVKEPELNTLIKLFPNPADEFIYIESDYDELQFQIMDILGKVVIMQESYENKTEIDLSEIQSGIYFITINSSENKIIKKFIKR
jgi:hypothetical protein